MTIAKAIEVGEKAVKDLAAKKEADRLAKLSPEDKKAEEKAQSDKAVLEAKDETLDDAGKKRKSEIIESQKKAKDEEAKRLLEAKDDDLSEDEQSKKTELVKKTQIDKDAEVAAKIQARIDEIAGELKAERAERVKDKEKIAALEGALTKLKDGDPSKIQSEVKRLEAERVSKLIEADKAKDRADRREMSKADLEEWMVEDMTSANEWLADRAVRRDKERTEDQARLTKPKDEVNPKAQEVLRQQEESNRRVFSKHPELNVKQRIADMRAAGKTDKEIQDTIKNDPKCKLAIEIIQSDEDRYLLAGNGPELVMAEMEKRLAKNQGETQEEHDKRIVEEALEAERQRIANIDEGLNSTRGKGNDPKMSDTEKQQWTLFKKSFPQKTLADFKAMQERRRKYANA